MQIQVMRVQICLRARFPLSRLRFVVRHLAASCGILRHVVEKRCSMPCGDARHRSSQTHWTRMWADAQRDGRSAAYRWSPLFNTAKFGWRQLLEYRAVTLPRRESRWNLLECPKLMKRSQPLVLRSSPYCIDMWGRYCCLTSFFSDCRYMP